MRCEEARGMLSALLDDELRADERAVAEHVERCERCSLEAEALRALKHAVARLHAEEAPPIAVRAHIETLRLAGKRREWRVLAVAAASAMVFMVLATVVLWGLRRGDLSDTVAADHLKSNPAVIAPQVVTDSPASIEQFFAGATAFSPTVPRLMEAQLLGARLCHLDGETAELIFYRYESRNVSLFVTAVPPRVATCTENRGLTVCREKRNGLGIYAVSDLPEPSLRRLLGHS